MAQKTYLQLVNDAMAEAKVSVDPLTSADFATNDSHLLYGRFRTWVNQAYEELFMDRREWLFRVERATLEIYPRLHLAGLSTTPVVGHTYEGASSGVQFEVLAIHTHEDVEQDSVAEYTVSVRFEDHTQARNLIIREDIDTVTTNALWTAGHLKGWGTYDFDAEISSLGEVHQDSFRVREHTESHETATDNTRLSHLRYVPYASWNRDWLLQPLVGERPTLITRTSQGTYDFHPKPYDLVVLSFDYTQGVQLMSAHSDVPSALPAKYHDYLMWAAVRKFADWDRNQALWAYAIKHEEKYRNWLELYEMPEIGIVGWNGVIRRG